MNPESVYIDAPKEVMLTNKDFHDCSYYDKSIQFCNYKVIVDINQPRVIQLWTGSGRWHMLAKEIPFATKCYENSSIEAGFVRIVKNEITLAWVKRHFGYAILKETEDEIREMWNDMLGEDRRVTRYFYKNSKNYIDMEILEEKEEKEWEEKAIHSRNKHFKKEIELIHNPSIMQDGFENTKVTFMGYYLNKKDRDSGSEYIYLIWDTENEDRGYAEGFSKTGSSTGSHSFKDLKKYKKLKKSKFLEKFLEFNEYKRLENID